MEKQNQFQSLIALLPNGKVENDVRITEATVTGVCTVYLDRAADENAFFLRDIGVALIGDDLTSAVRLAVDQAYGAAISHLAAVTPAVIPQAAPSTPGRAQTRLTRSRNSTPTPRSKCRTPHSENHE